MTRAVLYMKIDAALKERIREIGDREHRTLSNMVEVILLNHARSVAAEDKAKDGLASDQHH